MQRVRVPVRNGPRQNASSPKRIDTLGQRRIGPVLQVARSTWPPAWWSAGDWPTTMRTSLGIDASRNTTNLTCAQVSDVTDDTFTGRARGERRDEADRVSSSAAHRGSWCAYTPMAAPPSRRAAHQVGDQADAAFDASSVQRGGDPPTAKPRESHPRGRHYLQSAGRLRCSTDADRGRFVVLRFPCAASVQAGRGRALPARACASAGVRHVSPFRRLV